MRLTKINKKRFMVMYIGFIFLTWENASQGVAYAETLRSQIAHLDTDAEAAKHPGRLVYLANGRVARIAPKQESLLQPVKTALQTGDWVEIETGERGYVTFVKKIARPADANRDYDLGGGIKPSTKLLAEYQPTVLPDMASAENIFRSMNSRYRSSSQCYNRAMVWTYEANQQWGLKSMKTFMFFTSKYIWDYDYGWWFHVTPSTLVMENGAPVEKTLDYAFMDGPVDMQVWTDFFITPHSVCPTVTHYRDYDQHQEEQYCYLIKVPMYFWQPQDIEALDRIDGKPKTEFLKDDVDTAYWQGFY